MPEPDRVDALRVEVNDKTDALWDADAKRGVEVLELQLWRARIGGFLLALTVMASLPAVAGAVVAVVVLLNN